MSAWWRRYEGPALAVFLITAIFMAGASWLKLETVSVRAQETANEVVINGNRVTSLEANQISIERSLAEIKQTLRDIHNRLYTNH